MLSGIPPAPRGASSNGLTFHVATHGTLCFGQTQDKVCAGLFDLPLWDEEVHARSMKEGILHELHDEKIYNLVQWRSTAAEVICKVEKTLDDEKEDSP